MTVHKIGHVTPTCTLNSIVHTSLDPREVGLGSTACACANIPLVSGGLWITLYMLSKTMTSQRTEVD